MAIQNSTISTNIVAQGNEKARSTPGTGVVYSVILDENHPRIKNSENIEEKTQLVGAIEFRYTGLTQNNEKNLPLAFPSEKVIKSLPVRNEVVEIISTGGGNTLYRRIGAEQTPNINSDPEYIKKTYPAVQEQNSSTDYKIVENTGLPKSTNSSQNKFDGFGDYFSPQKGIHKLKLFEGDSIIESRFGQSIRFSAYNNDRNEFSPSIIIRNSENSNSRQNLITVTTIEDINKDGSTIAITSDKYQSQFLPGTVDSKGNSDFNTNPTSFKNYPEKLIGDQIIMNSGRIILSSKNAEMMFFSKKNYGFISDGALSIDNALGIEVNVGADINVTTNDRNINLNTKNGKINLGNVQLEPIVKGNKLVDLLTELIDAIAKQNYLTPSGPSKIGPENLPTFNNIKSKLKTILSELNSTA
jgi:hypothetical protein